MTNIVVDKSTDNAEPLSICLLYHIFIIAPQSGIFFLWCAQYGETTIVAALNKRILRIIFADYLFSYDGLLAKVKLYAISTFKISSYYGIRVSFLNDFPAYKKNKISFRSSSYDLRGNYILSLNNRIT